jgi:ABC-type multidrug transport system ATPase subunit
MAHHIETEALTKFCGWQRGIEEPHALSKGNKQKLGVVQAFMRSAPARSPARRNAARSTC